MQSSKTSKKPRKGTEETVAAAPESGTASTEVNSKSRASKSSAPKKETGRAKHRNPGGSEQQQSASRAVDSPVIDPVGVMTPGPEAHDVPHAHIEKLAYSYWIARDYAHGFAEEDWHRAERELKQKR